MDPFGQELRHPPNIEGDEGLPPGAADSGGSGGAAAPPLLAKSRRGKTIFFPPSDTFYRLAKLQLGLFEWRID